MRSKIETNVEWMNKVVGDSEDLKALLRVAEKAEKLYLKTRNSASAQSAKRAREVVASKGWMQLHPVFGNEAGEAEEKRSEMLARISGYRPQETIFESKMVNGKSLRNNAAEIMKTMRQKTKLRDPVNEEEAAMAERAVDDDVGADASPFGEEDDEMLDADADEAAAEEGSDSDDGLEVTVSHSNKANKKAKGASATSFQDPEVFMTYEPRTINAHEERGYGVHSGGIGNSFVASARDATMDLANDEGSKTFGVPSRSKMRWDQKSRKYVARDNDEDGSKGARLVRGESGVKIAASFQSGRFDRWKKAQRVGKMPRVGEQEKSHASLVNASQTQTGGPRYKHKMEKAPKEADKFRDDYHQRKKRVDEAKEKRVGRFKDGVGVNKKELKGTDDVRKSRQLKAKRMAKNARPSRRK